MNVSLWEVKKGRKRKIAVADPVAEGIPDLDAPPFPAVIQTPDDLLAEAIAYVLTRLMRAVVYARAPHKAREVVKNFDLVKLIREPEETKIEITYTMDINTTAIIAALSLILPERGSETK